MENPVERNNHDFGYTGDDSVAGVPLQVQVGIDFDSDWNTSMCSVVKCYVCLYSLYSN